MLRMTVAAVAQAAGVAPNTIVRVEADKSVNTGTLDAIQAVYEAAGVRFTGEGCICAPPGSDALVIEEGREPRGRKNRPKRAGDVAVFAALSLLLPAVASARTTGPAEPPQACLSPAEMAALHPASREQAEDFCEASDARALERVRAVLRLLGTALPTPDATTDTAE